MVTHLYFVSLKFCPAHSVKSPILMLLFENYILFIFFIGCQWSKKSSGVLGFELF